MINGTGCCGFHVKDNGPNLLGLLTLACPLLLACGLVYPFLALVGCLHPGVRKLARQAGIILGADLRLIHRAQLLPRARCQLAGRIFPLSPKLSGAVYKNFNLAVLSAIWLIVVCLGNVVLSLT